MVIPARRRAGIPLRRSRPAPGGPRPRAEGKNERRRGPGSSIDPGPDSVRSAARDPAQHQGRRVYGIVRPVARIEAEGHPACAARPRAHETYRVPTLIVMATTNRGYILDMVPGQSFIEFLLKRGYDVYMLDWTAPKPEEKSLRMEDYVLDFIPDCVRRVQQDSGETDVTVIGYCFGGVLSLLYGSIFADGPMKNLICFTTPIDFREMKLFQNFSDRRYFDVDRLVDSIGNVPPEMILSSFEMLRPASRAASQGQLWENIWNDEFVKAFRMFDRGATDTLPLAGEYFRSITKDLMWDNKLFDRTMSVGGRLADLSKIKVPILHAVAEHDHIVPYDAAKPLIQKIRSTDKEEVMLKGGHVSLVAGANAIKRLWPKLDSWLGERST